MRNLLVFVMLATVGVVLAGCPDEKKDAASPSTTSGAGAASASASAVTPKAAGTDSKGSGW